ncbi:hypothetical protein BGW38_004568 [Lunasporangiospora selenospora]|uniref:Uncharacterized protein n=1 Tax=Lunasporangiospora selenospora TaxID=979761 RepID=A0A9P6FPM7_9FUNG|nr:hypothetical protein BGW38_004568 [Lunasporangiospora selenospora]
MNSGAPSSTHESTVAQDNFSTESESLPPVPAQQLSYHQDTHSVSISETVVDPLTGTVPVSTTAQAAPIDASGYPDRFDGLSAHQLQHTIQEPFERHKHQQVSEDDPGQAQHDQHPQHNSHSQHQPHHESVLDMSPIELAEKLHDPELRMQTGAPNFLR